MNMTSRLFIIVTTFAVFFSCKENKEPTAPKTIVAPKDSIQTSDNDSIGNPYVVVDVSPMDMSYFPVDYPKLKMAKQISQPPVMRLIYSRPHLQGRELFHDVLKYGEYWRLG